MIILVAVTLNIALGENGLIAKAKETRTKQEEQTIYEDIQGMMELNNNGEINVEKTFGNVVEKYTPEKVTPNTIAEGAESIEFTVQGKYGTYNYEIKTTEIAEKIISKDFDLEKYILGEGKQGKSVWEIINIDAATGTIQFIDDPETVDTDESKIISYIGESEGGTEIVKDENKNVTGIYAVSSIYIKYNNKIYRFLVKADKMLDPIESFKSNSTFPYSDTEKIKEIGSPEEKEVIQLGGKNWIILNRNGDNVDLISEETLNIGGVRLGDSGNGTEEERLSDAQASYNNAIAILNKASTDAAKDVLIQIDGIEYSVANEKLKYTGTIDGETYEEEIKVRSVGSNPTNPTSDNVTNFKVSDIPLKNNDGTTVFLKGFDDKGKEADFNYIYDYDRMIALGILKGIDRTETDSEEERHAKYWFASRDVYVYEGGDGIDFLIRYNNADEYVKFDYYLWKIDPDFTEKCRYSSDTIGVRPVISLSSKLLNELTK